MLFRNQTVGQHLQTDSQASKYNYSNGVTCSCYETILLHLCRRDLIVVPPSGQGGHTIRSGKMNQLFDSSHFIYSYFYFIKGDIIECYFSLLKTRKHVFFSKDTENDQKHSKLLQSGETFTVLFMQQIQTTNSYLTATLYCCQWILSISHKIEGGKKSSLLAY